MASETSEHPHECADADYWHKRFESMRETYRLRWSEGLSMADWHRQYCGAAKASLEMQDKIAKVVALLDEHPHFISAEDVARMLRPLLPKPPQVAPRCDRSRPEAKQEGPQAL